MRQISGDLNRASPQSARSGGAASSTAADYDLWQPGDMAISLEPEFYSAALVSGLHLHQQRHSYERKAAECFFTLGMLAVACMQCLTVFGMASYLGEKDNGYMDEFKLGTGLFVTGGVSLSVGHVQDLCGTFNHIGLNKLTGSGSLTMPDGTEFAGTPAMPTFHSYKMPSGSWNFHSIGKDESYIDKQLRVVHGADWTSIVAWQDLLISFQQFRVDFGVLFVIMVGWLWYHVLFELRKIVKFVFVLHSLYDKGLVTNTKQTTTIDPDSGSITITNLTLNAFLIGYLCVVCRLLVSMMMLIWGTSLLAASWNKLSLVLNSLAIGIVFELDVIIAYAVIDHNTMQRIETIQPIRTTREFRYIGDILFSILMLVGVFCGALLVRVWQVGNHSHQLQNAAALCLFAGPAPQMQHAIDLTPYPVLAPVPGFCESLLSMTCAPHVSGPGGNHGPCLITDENIFHDKSLMMYADDHLFEDMYDVNGTRRSMKAWGGPQSKLLTTKTWENDKHLNLFRRVCMQLYQPQGALDRRVVDPSVGLTMHSAPFYCPRERLFEAVFGKAEKDFKQWSASFDLSADAIVAALDRCHESPPLTKVKPQVDHIKVDNKHSQISIGAPSPAPAPAPAVDVAAVPASTNLLRATHHRRVHHELYQHKIQRSL